MLPYIIIIIIIIIVVVVVVVVVVFHRFIFILHNFIPQYFLTGIHGTDLVM